MAPSPIKKRPSHKSTSPSPKRTAPNKRRASAPLPGPPAKAQFKKSTRPLSATTIAVVEKNKRRLESQQVSLPFESAERFKVGLKLLLDESIYDDVDDVSVRCKCTTKCIAMNHVQCKLSLTFVSIHFVSIHFV